ncbi:MAG: hypothetical protein COV72_03275 [Candidatus Omnitrophica bacterium CG11_big_fil_rev_8_21_14_0_20_42_13]|uniref:D,D-heptose 1,7-bisphosphate phosphatase n=1 Tax=Candidatus Ghiorseimicrobium undicola TaxID=1974746 RepID=A0A2H0LYC3_9BACT|nr:MAG: hypothetical protein COV72_03275 [Candidatus Omnitrophica bacterium CG11_big_fil_rev_8_21_14_0_20_42_13]
MKKIIFLDRDGVINGYPGDGRYVTKMAEFRFLPGAKKAIARLTEEGFDIFIISNQAGVSKGLYSYKELDKITRHMLKGIESAGGNISRVYYCIHQDKHKCACRKPKTGLIRNALKEAAIGKAAARNAFFIGDSIRDVITAKRAKIKSILVFSGKEKPSNRSGWEIMPDYTAKDLFSAVGLILRLNAH